MNLVLSERTSDDVAVDIFPSNTRVSSGDEGTEDASWSTALPLIFRIERRPNSDALNMSMQVVLKLDPHHVLQDVDALRKHPWGKIADILNQLDGFDKLHLEFAGAKLEAVPTYARPREVLRTVGDFVQHEIGRLLPNVPLVRYFNPSLWRFF